MLKIGNWSECLFQKKVGTAEKILKSKTHNGAFWPYLKRRFGSSNWGETFEIKNGNRCILTELLRKCWNQGRLNSPFWRYLKRWFGSWDCRETFENKDANWCFLAVFETIFLKLELLMHSNAFYSMFSEVGNAEKPFKTRSLNLALCHNLKRCFASWNCWTNFEKEVA